MHILIIPSEEYVPEDTPLAGIFQHDQAQILQKEGNKVGVLSFSLRITIGSHLSKTFKEGFLKFRLKIIFDSLFFILKKLFFPLMTSINVEKKDGITIFRSDVFLGLRSSASHITRLECYKKFSKYSFSKYIENHGKPEIIHAHNMNQAGLIGEYLSEKFDIPLIITEHSSEHILKGMSTELLPLVQHSFKCIKNINAVSPALARQLEDKYNLESGKIKWLPNVIDKAFEKEELKVIKNSNESITILSIGNLIPLKGHKDLIHAFSLAFKGCPETKLRIGGSGPLSEELLTLIKFYGVDSQVDMLGYLSRNEVLREMKKCDFFAFPSHYETFGVVLTEALALGKPVLATYCGGPECIVNKTNGVLVEAQNIVSIKEGLLKMTKEINNFDSKFIRQDLITNFGSESFINRINKVYNKAIHDNHN